jgi:hypothetical protein
MKIRELLGPSESLQFSTLYIHDSGLYWLLRLAVRRACAASVRSAPPREAIFFTFLAAIVLVSLSRHGWYTKRNSTTPILANQSSVCILSPNKRSSPHRWEADEATRCVPSLHRAGSKQGNLGRPPILEWREQRDERLTHQTRCRLKNLATATSLQKEQSVGGATKYPSHGSTHTRGSIYQKERECVYRFER